MSRDWRDSYDTVRVWRREAVGTDPMGEPVYEWSYEDVRGVNVSECTPEAQSRGDTASGLRPDGVRVEYRLAFPRGAGHDLRHARVTFPSWGQDATTWPEAEPHAMFVSGDPRPMMRTTRWDTIAEVGRTDG